MVMSVRAPEIAIGQKDDGTNLSRPIQEGGFDKAFDGRVHDARCMMHDARCWIRESYGAVQRNR